MSGMIACPQISSGKIGTVHVANGPGRQADRQSDLSRVFSSVGMGRLVGNDSENSLYDTHRMQCPGVPRKPSLYKHFQSQVQARDFAPIDTVMR